MVCQLGFIYEEYIGEIHMLFNKSMNNVMLTLSSSFISGKFPQLLPSSLQISTACESNSPGPYARVALSLSPKVGCISRKPSEICPHRLLYKNARCVSIDIVNGCLATITS